MGTLAAHNVALGGAVSTGEGAGVAVITLIFITVNFEKKCYKIHKNAKKTEPSFKPIPAYNKKKKKRFPLFIIHMFRNVGKK